MIREAQLDIAFHQILKLADGNPKQTQFVQLNSQWSEIKSLYLNGRLTFDVYFSERSRITLSFLTWLDDLEEFFQTAETAKTIDIEEHKDVILAAKALLDYHQDYFDPPAKEEDKIQYAYYWASFMKKNIKALKK